MTRYDDELKEVVRWDGEKPIEIDGRFIGHYKDFSTYCTNGGDGKTHHFYKFKMRGGFEIIVCRDDIDSLWMNWDKNSPTLVFTNDCVRRLEEE